jgi:chloride channel 7
LQGFLIQALFVAPAGTFHVSSLLIFSTFYYVLAALTYGAFIPSGLFTVSLIFGGCFGRMVGDILANLGWIDNTIPGIVGMYALMGSGNVLVFAWCVGSIPNWSCMHNLP